MAFTIQEANGLATALGGAMNTIKTNTEDREEKELLAKFREQTAANGGDPTKIDPSLYSTPIGMRAMGKFRDELLKDEQFKKIATQINRDNEENNYRNMSALFTVMQQSVNDPDTFTAATDAFNKHIQSPVSIEREGMGFRLFENGLNGEKTPLGDVMTAQQVTDALNPYTDKARFGKVSMGFRRQVEAQNSENMKDPNTWYYSLDKAGNRVTFIPTRQWKDGVGFQYGYNVLSGGKNAMFMNTEQAASHYDLMDMKGLRDKETALAKEKLDMMRARLIHGGYRNGAQQTQTKNTFDMPNNAWKALIGSGMISDPNPEYLPGVNDDQYILNRNKEEAMQYFYRGDFNNNTPANRNAFIRTWNEYMREADNDPRLSGKTKEQKEAAVVALFHKNFMGEGQTQPTAYANTPPQQQQQTAQIGGTAEKKAPEKKNEKVQDPTTITMPGQLRQPDKYFNGAKRGIGTNIYKLEEKDIQNVDIVKSGDGYILAPKGRDYMKENFGTFKTEENAAEYLEYLRTGIKSLRGRNNDRPER